MDNPGGKGKKRGSSLRKISREDELTQAHSEREQRLEVSLRLLFLRLSIHPVNSNAKMYVTLVECFH